LDSHPFLQACRRQPTPFTPIWLMRQAGRYMAEYRAVRERFGFLELCHNPQAAAEVTVTAVERLGVDAAIIFADILLVLEPLGAGVEFSSGDGPVVRRPVQAPDDVARLTPYDPDEALAFVYDAVRRARQGLGGRVPLIGFSGAPFTLASYLIEGGGARNYARTKTFMYRHPDAWHALLGRLAGLINAYLRGQTPPAPTPSNSSTVGWGACVRRITAAMSCRAHARCSRMRLHRACRSSTSVPTRPGCSAPCATPAAT
jgi:uroporphyrinogen decarboxylase